MLLSKNVSILTTKRNFIRLKNTYCFDDTVKVGDIIIVSVDKLTKGSSIEVEVSCDYCGNESSIPYKRYLKQIADIPKVSCSKCSSKKIKDVNQFRYGVDNVFQLDGIKEKTKETLLERYNVSHPMYLEETKSKIRETSLEKYGVTHYTKTEEYIGRVKETNLKKYGKDFYLSTDDKQNKSKQTCLEKYGVEYISQSNIHRNKVIATNLKNWGVECNLQNEDIKDRIKITNIERYGSENVSQSEYIRKKYHKICQDESYIEYIGDNISLYNCVKGHTYSISSDNYINRKDNVETCTICNPIGNIHSFAQKELYDFIKDNYTDEVIMDYKDGLHIDIYLPKLNIGLEYNGLYWHSEEYKNKNYHIDKTNYFKERDIRIIHIWEDDWLKKKDIIKSQILNIIGNSNRIYARKCIVREVSIGDTSEFLNNNHIQGSDKSNKKIGLYHEDILVSIMTFNKLEGRNKMKDTEWNLSRFCNMMNVSVVGGASKLLKYFIRNHDVSRIISYADHSWSEGNLYNMLGFKLINTTRPDYKYVIDGERKHKSNYTKTKLKTTLVESVYMRSQGYYRIWDCGKMKFEYLI